MTDTLAILDALAAEMWEKAEDHARRFQKSLDEAHASQMHDYSESARLVEAAIARIRAEEAGT